MSGDWEQLREFTNVGSEIWEEKRLLARLLLHKYDMEILGKGLKACHYKKAEHGGIHAALQSPPSKGSSVPLIDVLKRFDETEHGDIYKAIEEILEIACSAPLDWGEMVEIAFNIRLRYEKREMCAICKCGQPFEPDPEEYLDEEFEDYDFDPGFDPEG